MRHWLLILFIFSYLPLLAQTDTGTAKPANVRPVTPKRTVVRTDSTRKHTVVRPPAVHRTDSTGKKAGAVPPFRPDSAKTADSLKKTAADTVAAAPKKPSAYVLYLQKLTTENIFLKKDKPRFNDANILRPYRNLDWLVYLITGVILLLGIIRLGYMKYFADLFRAFFNPTLSQRQLKDQLSQSPFPNLLLNIFFAVALGVYLYLVMYRQQFITNANPLILIPGLILLVAVIYTLKYLMLRFCGWLFGNVDLADAYIFILYLINKILGVVLVPFLVIIAFGKPELARAFLYLSIFFIVVMVLYRYIRSYSLVKQYLSFSRLHFFLYLCAFEVAPVLILTKVLLIYLVNW